MNRRDIELLSAYLDGELKATESTRLETRLKTDPELANILNDLRSTRTLLRKLPTRKAPRNFTLTRKMVGQNPPLPRAFPIFRLATAVATLLFFFTIGLNFVGTQMAAQPPAFGMGGGGGAAEQEMQSYAAEEAPAEEPAAAAPMAPAPAEPAAPADATNEEPALSMAAPQATELPPTEEAARIMETPVQKDGTGENGVAQDQFQVQTEPQAPAPLISPAWQIGLVVVAVVGLLLMGLMRQLSARRWK